MLFNRAFVACLPPLAYDVVNLAVDDGAVLRALGLVVQQIVGIFIALTKQHHIGLFVFKHNRQLVVGGRDETECEFRS